MMISAVSISSVLAGESCPVVCVVRGDVVRFRGCHAERWALLGGGVVTTIKSCGVRASEPSLLYLVSLRRVDPPTVSMMPALNVAGQSG